MKLLLLSVLMLNICGTVADDDEGFSTWGAPWSQTGGGDSGEVTGGFGYQGNMYYGTGQTGQTGNYQGYPVNYGNPLIQGYPGNYGNAGNQGYPMYPGSSGGRSSQGSGGVQGGWYPAVQPTNTFVSGGVSPNIYHYMQQGTGSVMAGGDSSAEKSAAVYPQPTMASSEEQNVSPVGDYYDYSDEHVHSTATSGGDSYDSGENVPSTASTGSDSDDSGEHVPVAVTTGGDSDSSEHLPSPTFGVMGGDSGDSGENQVRVIYPGQTVVVGDGDNSAETVLGGGINLTPSGCQELLEIVAVVDGSDSISAIDFQTLKHTLLTMVDQLNINDNNQRFGVVLYSTNISAVINLSGDAAYLKLQISQLGHPRDGTNTADGISAMNDMLQRYARPGVPKVAVVITDGISKNPGATAQAARVSKLLGVNMFAVGVGLKTDIVELQSIASGSDHVLTVAQFQQLDGLLDQLFKRVCPVQGGWTHWADSYGACSVSCGGGSQVITRTRTCTNPAPANGGLYCVGDAVVTLAGACNTHGCPVNGGWSLWIDTVAQCSVSCGGGSQLVTRTRTCTNPAPAYNGLYCVGHDRATFTQACNTQGCPVDGGWSVWTDTVAQCSVSCGGGSQLVTRTRTCTNPAPAYNGPYCVGDDKATFTQACNTQGCSVDGGWSVWTDTVAQCSVSCGGGSQLVTRTRTCTNPAPAYNGQYCVGDDRATFTQACNTQGCPVDGGWSVWMDTVAQCSVSCGGGSQLVTRTRTCTNPAPAYYGQYCVGDDRTTFTQACNTQGCPVDGGWSLWTDTVAQCSVSCGGGSQLVTRTRTCTNPAPAYNGQHCVGDDRATFTQACNTQGCPVDGGWSNWTDTVGQCSVSCGGGSQLVTRTRTCTNPAPAYNGLYCVGDDRTTFTQACNTQGCPVDGGWTAWTEAAGECSLTCGGGTQTVVRMRSCTKPAPSAGGSDCVGEPREIVTRACNTQQCPVTTTEKPDLGLCNDCKMDNGIGYNPHPSDCNKYIQCTFDNKQLIKVQEMECPHGLYWDQDKLTCNRPEEVTCPAERCNDPMTTSYPSATTCSGYWECVGGVSKGRCCPEGQAYSIAGYCVPSTTCKTPCKGDGGQGACDKRPVAGDSSRFQQFAKGHGWITLTCAPGSSYNSTECRCSIQGGIISPDTCKPEVYLSFTDDVGDKSDSGVYIQNDGVKVRNGVGYFDGKSGLRIPRFANAGLGSTVYIRIRYRGEGSATRKQALLSNGDCGKDSSITIARGPASTYFGVRSEANKSAGVSVSSLSNGWNEAFFKLDGGMLSGSVGSSMKQTALLGNVQRANCAMQIGRGTNYANFRGYMDNLTIYLCRP
ncbi:uncharacterized protein LOC124124837 isoform X11 [Haliotis rufescens]|uniref:uncharacterized protein LOC124124837 isoform X11 n=1 Tax=Haliotis rufescens TaxID=6454 RepID=UPI00201EAD96|nr:uncharacterized protein LOC124124837 isoform X11 [Haliotis rufescens]